MNNFQVTEKPEDYYSNPRIRYAESLEDSIQHLPKNKDEPDSARLIYIPGRPLDEFKIVAEIGFEAVRNNLKKVSQFNDQGHFEEWCDQQEEVQRPLLSAVYNKLSEIRGFYSEHISPSLEQYTVAFDGKQTCFHDDALIPDVIHYAAYGFGNEAIIDELSADQYYQIEYSNQAVGHRGILTKPGDAFIYVNSGGDKDGKADCTSVKHRGYTYKSDCKNYLNQSLRYSIAS